jgi:hypothetical protein
MKIINKRELVNLANIKTEFNTYNARNIVNEARRFSRSLYTTSIFLSHSHLDEELVESMIIFFRTLGVDVYVDWKDDSMPASTSGITAMELKEKIRDNDKFIFLATNNSLKSKWCNWEIGYGDANKYIDKIAVFPLADDTGYWTGQEYLQIYPSIQKLDYLDKFYIVNPKGSMVDLIEWLKK